MKMIEGNIATRLFLSEEDEKKHKEIVQTLQKLVDKNRGDITATLFLSIVNALTKREVPWLVSSVHEAMLERGQVYEDIKKALKEE